MNDILHHYRGQNHSEDKMIIEIREREVLLGSADRHTVCVAFDEVTVFAGPAVLLHYQRTSAHTTHLDSF